MLAEILVFQENIKVIIILTYVVVTIEFRSLEILFLGLIERLKRYPN